MEKATPVDLGGSHDAFREDGYKPAVFRKYFVYLKGM